MGTRTDKFDYWQIKQTRSLIRLFDCRELIDDFRAMTRGLTFEPARSHRQRSVELTYTRARHGYARTIHGPLFDEPRRTSVLRTTTEAAADMQYYLVNWIADRRPDHLCVHCAAVEFKGSLVIFPNRMRAGKSTLAISLAAQGHRVFGDDFLHVDHKTRRGISGGALPRLRLPLPGMPRHCRAFIEERIGLHDHRELYVNLRPSEFAPFGESRSINGIVLLDRNPRFTSAQLTPISTAEALRGLVDREFNKTVKALGAFNLLHAIAAGSRCYSLQYSELGPAVRALARAYGG